VRRTKFEPMKPAPPVTRIFTGPSLPEGSFRFY
jgi:hypothetical protein